MLSENKNRRIYYASLRISVYPEKSTQKEVYDYLELAKYGFSRIFTCLLSVNDPKRKDHEGL